jgi:phage/plasmid-like protein (TIGR03299 family)
MAHNLDFSTGKAGFAFIGSRDDIWHRLGQQMQAGMSMEQWARQSGLDWTAIKVPAIAALTDSRFDHIDASERFAQVPDRFFVARSDTAHILSPGTVSDVYQPVQPSDLLGWFERYISVDDRFRLDAAGSLLSGEKIWATATFNGDYEIAGSKHVARLLMTTTFDGTGATINQATMVRVVCNNTLNMAVADKRAVIKTRHNTKFDGARVGRELSELAKSFETFKAMGDALAVNEMSKADVSAFFKQCLDIPFEVKPEDVSTRKMNQFAALGNAYRATVAEGTEAGTAWTALQAVTRYVDHDRSTRSSSGNEIEAKALSSQFGSGAALKGKAMDLLLPRIKDKVLIAA